ncbi:YkgJ family cysteine cluster protein [Pseudanabaena sp. 'Roaring Creek']|uniref:YkgJ family cysteine cluster protein n=1 Tax=Pseudanabaena sp. 'Roaring Creek' TaxID=1681830 RepID=UPI0006D83E7A|nr:YkgJ family cysteine cluster protein [Pseudanabaena sp. 'Roaring Creek']
MSTWQCISGCGACCNLTPSDRPDLADYLTPVELQQYLSMVGHDGWCINFDHIQRQCKIYDQRPRFCRVATDTFYDMFGVEPKDLDEFAISCCQETIASIYGDRSLELLRFNQTVNGD